MLSLERQISLTDEEVQHVISNDYETAADGLVWPKIARVVPMSTRKKLVNFLIPNARLQDRGVDGGTVEYTQTAGGSLELEARVWNSGKKIPLTKFNDQDKLGFQEAVEWAEWVNGEIRVLPEKLLVGKLLNNGENYTSWDGVAYFGTTHPVDPKRSSLGQYANLLTSSASGIYPGACPIDTSVSRATAVNNLRKVFAYIASIKLANGETLRNLEPAYLVGPKSLYPLMVQLTDAKFLADVAGSGLAQGGTTDFEAFIKSMGMAMPMASNYLSTAYDSTYGSETTYYVVCKQNSTSTLGGVLYSEVEPFSTTFYSPFNGNFSLAEERAVAWISDGRVAYGPGQPFAIFKVKAS